MRSDHLNCPQCGAGMVRLGFQNTYVKYCRECGFKIIEMDEKRLQKVLQRYPAVCAVKQSPQKKTPNFGGGRAVCGS